MTLVASIVGYLFTPGLLSLGLLLMVVRSLVGDGGLETAIDSALRVLCRTCLLTFGVNLRVHGISRVDPDRPTLYLANHVSILDPIVLFAAIRERVRGVELDDHFRWPIWGAITRSAGTIPISHRNTTSAIASLRHAVAKMRAGTSLVILPEGHRTRTGELGRFMSGPFRVAREAGVGIVPIAMRGLYERKNVHSPRVHPGRVDVVFGEQIDAATVASTSERGLRELAHGAIAALLRTGRAAPR